VGGLPGIIALATAGTVLFWRTKFPQIGAEYLERELTRYRAEIAIADQDRVKLRQGVNELKNDIMDLENRYMLALEEKEVMAQELRHLRRSLRPPAAQSTDPPITTDYPPLKKKEEKDEQR
jgi:hypothetical protein